MVLSSRALGSSRAKAVFDLVVEHGCLNTEQVEALLFPHSPSGKRKAQLHLRTLTVHGRLKRWRLDLDQPFAYYLNERGAAPSQMEHVVGVNWAYCWLRTRLQTWHRLEHWNTEAVLGALRADAVCGIHNIVGNTWQTYFIEHDRSTSRNTFDKVQLYNDLYEQEHVFTGEWWEVTGRFPHILVVTDSPRRKAHIEQCILQHNRNALCWQVMLIQDMRKEVLAYVRDPAKLAR